jgi:hypothetical protein
LVLGYWKPSHRSLPYPCYTICSTIHPLFHFACFSPPFSSLPPIHRLLYCPTRFLCFFSRPLFLLFPLKNNDQSAELHKTPSPKPSFPPDSL